MKISNKIIIAFVALFATLTTSAQMRTAYFMEGSYFRTDMNAALAPTRGYLQILPVVGGLGVNVGNNYLSVNNLFYKRDGGLYTFMSNKVSADEFLGRLENKGKLSMNLNTSIVGFGAHTKKLFWSVGVNLRSNTEITLSKDMFAALKNLSNGVYNLGDTHISNREYIEAAIGVAIPIKEFMTFGFRVKGLVGMADLSMKMDNKYEIPQETIDALGITYHQVFGGKLVLDCTKPGAGIVKLTFIAGGTVAGGGQITGGMKIEKEFALIARPGVTVDANGQPQVPGGWL
jgi:hypothetical protein